MVDISRIAFTDDFLSSMAPLMRKAYHAMADLERGGIANPDEERMVGHYWLRSPDLAPTTEIRDMIEITIKNISAFAGGIHSGVIFYCAPPGATTENDLIMSWK